MMQEKNFPEDNLSLFLVVDLERTVLYILGCRFWWLTGVADWSQAEIGYTRLIEWNVGASSLCEVLIGPYSSQGNCMSEAAMRLHIEPLSEGGFVATSPDVPGLVAEGQSLVEVTEIARQVARGIVESCMEHGDPLPKALAEIDVSKPIDLTIPVGIR